VAPPAPPGPGPGPAPAALEEAARTGWAQARADLVAGRYEPALAAYRRLLDEAGGSALVRDHRKKIEAGLRAAKVGVHGPAALLSVPAEGSGMKVEAEYVFDDSTLVDRDFTTAQPFASDLTEKVEAGEGKVRLSGASGLFHNLVFGADVRFEAEVTLETARDLGVIALQDSDDYRAVVLTLNNTRWKLKKGDDATPQPGHVLWFVGEGAWAQADAGVHGFIKIAERTTSKLADRDRGRLEFTRKKDRCEAGFQGKSDGVFLEGTVKGDDGRGMGRAQIGLCTNGGTLVVHSIKVSGTVDETWFKAHLADLVALDPGPP
jgi:hypothetical protein